MKIKELLITALFGVIVLYVAISFLGYQIRHPDKTQMRCLIEAKSAMRWE